MHQFTSSFSSSPSISNFISSHPSLTLLETSCTTMRDLHQLHSQIIRTGLARDPIAISRLLSFCAASADLRYAALLFSHTPTPTAFMYNTLIRAFSKSSNPKQAISLFHQMLHSPTTPPQSLTFPSLFTAYAHLNSPDDGSQLHGLVLKLGLACDPYVHNSILSMYATCGRLMEAYRLFDVLKTFDSVPFNSMIVGLAKKGLVDESRRLFDSMPMRNLVTWSAMISGYVRNGRSKEALDLFRRMQVEGIEPNGHTMVSLLGACSRLGALEQGEWLHDYIEKKRFATTNVIVTNAIVDMYCKCGRLDKAMEVFEKASVKGLSTWNAMMSGLAVHGQGREAVRMFEKLELSNLRPDYVSFISILTACNHSGLVDRARNYFARMVEVYGIEPGIEHYGCLVDAFGRAGLTEEAEGLIGRMPMEPDAIIWASLLSACRKCEKVDVSERAAARLVELDPGDSGGYVMLSNNYANGTDFGGAVKARVAMKAKGVRKAPGCSMIEVNGETHEFVAGGMLHSQAGEICQVLVGLVVLMTEENSPEELEIQCDGNG